MPPRASASARASAKAAPKRPAGGKSKPGAAAAAGKAREPLPVPERVKRLFGSLCAQIDGGYLTNAIKTCDKILRLEPSDKDALQTKLFLLLQTEQYGAALALTTTVEGYAYEKAYSLYRLQREAGAKEVVETLRGGEDDRGISHLEAQIAYRGGDYETAVDLYTQLLDSAEPSSEEHADIATNLQATQQHVDFLESGYLSALDALPGSVLSTLESAPPPAPSSSALASLNTATSAPAPAPALAPAGKKAPRARRVPKGVVPGAGAPPDPERWLKKTERSTYRAQKARAQKGGAGAGGATQGVVMDAPAAGGGGGGKSAKGKKKK